MVSIALCDDEQKYLDYYSDKLKQLAHLNKTTLDLVTFSKGESLLFYIEDHPFHFDIVYLDIQLASISGIKVAKEIKKINPAIQIIFITASDSYVFEAFDISPANYLLKTDRDDVRFANVFKMALKNISLMSRDYFINNTRNNHLVVPFNQIYYFEIFKRIIVIHTKDKEYEFYGKMSELEKKLEEKPFVRTHRSYLVNMQYIERITSSFAELKNGDTIPLTESYYEKALLRFNKYLTGAL